MPRYADITGTEAYTKRHAILYARAQGYTVVDTASHKAMPRAGIPDAFIGHRREPGRWIAVDFKSRNGRLSAEQQVLFDDGMLCIVDSVDAMVAVMQKQFPHITK
jgi:hypothetical protein